MTKRNQDTTAAPRETADAAVTTWRELDATAKAKREACHSFGATVPADKRAYAPLDRRRPLPSDLRMAELHREALEAEDAAERARHAATTALDAAEVAEKDERAIARDPRSLRDNLAAIDAEEQALQGQILDVRRRRKERFDSAFKADVEHAVARSAATLPPSPPVPRLGHLGEIVNGTFRRTYLEGLSEFVDRSAQAPSKAGAIANARADEERICADLEEWRVHDEAIAHDKAVLAANKEREGQQANKRMADNAKAQQDAFAAERARREKMAADYRARQAGGPAQ